MEQHGPGSVAASMIRRFRENKPASRVDRLSTKEVDSEPWWIEKQHKIGSDANLEMEQSPYPRSRVGLAAGGVSMSKSLLDSYGSDPRMDFRLSQDRERDRRTRSPSPMPTRFSAGGTLGNSLIGDLDDEIKRELTVRSPARSMRSSARYSQDRTALSGSFDTLGASGFLNSLLKHDFKLDARIDDKAGGGANDRGKSDRDVEIARANEEYEVTKEKLAKLLSEIDENAKKGKEAEAKRDPASYDAVWTSLDVAARLSGQVQDRLQQQAEMEEAQKKRDEEMKKLGRDEERLKTAGSKLDELIGYASQPVQTSPVPLTAQSQQSSEPLNVQFSQTPVPLTAQSTQMPMVGGPVVRPNQLIAAQRRNADLMHQITDREFLRMNEDVTHLRKLQKSIHKKTAKLSQMYHDVMRDENAVVAIHETGRSIDVMSSSSPMRWAQQVPNNSSDARWYPGTLQGRQSGYEEFLADDDDEDQFTPFVPTNIAVNHGSILNAIKVTEASLAGTMNALQCRLPGTVEPEKDKSVAANSILPSPVSLSSPAKSLTEPAGKPVSPAVVTTPAAGGAAVVNASTSKVSGDSAAPSSSSMNSANHKPLKDVLAQFDKQLGPDSYLPQSRPVVLSRYHGPMSPAGKLQQRLQQDSSSSSSAVNAPRNIPWVPDQNTRRGDYNGAGQANFAPPGTFQMGREYQQSEWDRVASDPYLHTQGRPYRNDPVTVRGPSDQELQQRALMRYHQHDYADMASAGPTVNRQMTQGQLPVVGYVPGSAVMPPTYHHSNAAAVPTMPIPGPPTAGNTAIKYSDPPPPYSPPRATVGDQKQRVPQEAAKTATAVPSVVGHEDTFVSASPSADPRSQSKPVASQSPAVPRQESKFAGVATNIVGNVIREGLTHVVHASPPRIPQSAGPNIAPPSYSGGNNAGVTMNHPMAAQPSILAGSIVVNTAHPMLVGQSMPVTYSSIPPTGASQLFTQPSHEYGRTSEFDREQYSVSRRPIPIEGQSIRQLREVKKEQQLQQLQILEQQQQLQQQQQQQQKAAMRAASSGYATYGPAYSSVAGGSGFSTQPVGMPSPLDGNRNPSLMEREEYLQNMKQFRADVLRSIV
jgi:hypothetical protein